MSKPAKNEEANTEMIRAFRAYLQTVITAQQFGQTAKLSALPAPKTVNYCASLAKLPDNQLARELAAPVWAIVDQISDVAMDLFRPLYQKTIKDPAQQAQHEQILSQLDYALALILQRVASLTRFRSKHTRCADLLCHTIWGMNQGPDSAQLIRRWQKMFPDDGLEPDGSVEPGSFPDQFAWDVYQRVEALDRLVDDFPDHIRIAARRMHGWPMLAHRHTNNRKRFEEVAKRLELGTEYPLDATEGARFRPDTPMVRYLDPLICKLNYVRTMMEAAQFKSAEEDKERLRSWLWECQDGPPSDFELEAAGILKQLPALTKATAAEWAEKAVVPYIVAGDACDWKNCTDPALRRIARQNGVKSRATFKSRLLSAVSATLKRLARSK